MVRFSIFSTNFRTKTALLTITDSIPSIDTLLSKMTCLERNEITCCIPKFCLQQFIAMAIASHFYVLENKSNNARSTFGIFEKFNTSK